MGTPGWKTKLEKYYAAKSLVEGIEASRDVAGLISALQHADPDVRSLAAGALGRIGDPQAVKPLIAALKDDSARHMAVCALGDIGDMQAVEPIIDVLKVGYEGLREDAVRALGKIGDPRAVDCLISALLNDAYFPVQMAAAEALGDIGDERAVEPLTLALGGHYSVHLRASEAIKKIRARGQAS